MRVRERVFVLPGAGALAQSNTNTFFVPPRVNAACHGLR